MDEILKPEQLEQAKLIFGEDTQLVELRAFHEMTTGGNDLEGFVKECLQNKNCFSLRNPLGAVMTEVKMRDRLSDLVCEILSGERENECTPVFFKDAVLAMFDTINRIDRKREGNYPTGSFHRSFPRRVDEIITSANGRKFWAEDRSASLELFEQNLSMAVKQYARWGINPPCHGRGKRVADVFNILKRVHKKMEDEELKFESESSAGRMILEQLCYAVFGMISTQGKTQALAGLHNEMIITMVSPTA